MHRHPHVRATVALMLSDLRARMTFSGPTGMQRINDMTRLKTLILILVVACQTPPPTVQDAEGDVAMSYKDQVAAWNAMSPSERDAVEVARRKREESRRGHREFEARTDTKYWYAGGTLHGSKMDVWFIATEGNRLATASDFAVKLMEDAGMSVRSIADVKPVAVWLEDNISEAGRAGAADGLNVAEIAAAVWLLRDL